MSSVGLDFLFKDFDEAFVEDALKFASAVASPARQSLFVNLRAITSETNKRIVLVINLLLFFFGSDELTVDFLLFAFDYHLASFAFGLDAPIAADFLHVFENL